MSIIKNAEVLTKILSDAAAGRFPAPDGSVDVIGSPAGPVDAVLGFTAHHVVAADVDPDEICDHLRDDDVGAAMDPSFLAWLGERIGAYPGMIDLVMAAYGTADTTTDLIPADDLAGHPRVQRSQQYRVEVEVYRDASGAGTLTIGRGLSGRYEVSVEVDSAARSRGLGRRLAVAATHLIPEGVPLFAQVTPGNIASIRTFLAAGFDPIGSEVLFLRI
ncbi:MAG: GNAT family N-acetyltransferase [Acidimicrobiia bacterium]|nr:GNAT family N-acetyltransferase [Acidimicrobiia bacterium]